jgi:hypothetical protein
MSDTDIVSGMFRLAAKRHFISSELCSALSMRVAEDSAILDIARTANPGAFPPYLLMAAVHSLVLADPSCGLARFFPTVSGHSVPGEDIFPAFKAFVLENRAPIEAIIRSAHVNKTVLKRSACLRALLVDVAHAKGWKQAHLVDVGCGAGLNLLLDQWRIIYEGVGTVGPEDSPVRFSIEVRDGDPPLGEMPEILSRTGVDLDGFDLADEAQERWLLGSLFPDQPDVFDLTKKALSVLRKTPPQFVTGGAETELFQTLENLPGDAPVFVMHSMAIYQMRPEHKAAVNRAIQSAGQKRPVVRIGMEILGNKTTLIITESAAGQRAVGEADDDAFWMGWYDRNG